MNDHGDELFPDGTRRAGEDAVLAGRYKVVRELGRGAMGTVYLAEDRTLDRVPVAIKMLVPMLLQDAKAAEGLKKEALLARKLTHPNIVTLRTFESTPQGSFLVMDYVEGETLAQKLGGRGTLSEEEIRSLFGPLADALDYAHAKGVVHRDLKPSNILIDMDGDPLLTDFGIAREMKDSLTRVTGRMTSGTLPYMSPEQLRGKAPASAQDVYSLAATMYECLSGDPPFHRGEIAWQIANEAPEALPGVQTPLKQSILQGLAKAPEDRPVCCRALLSGAGVGTKHPVRSGTRRGVWIAVILLMGLAAGAWLALRDVAGPRGTSEEAAASERPGSSVPEAVDLVRASASIEAPLEGVWITGGSVLVRGRAEGAGEGLLVNGREARLRDGTFEHRLNVERDGALQIDVATRSGQVLAKRTVQVDRTAPVIEITTPPHEHVRMTEPLARLEGRVSEAHLASLTVNGERISTRVSGRFTWPVTLRPGEATTLRFEAVDAAGNEAVPVTRELIHEKPTTAWEAPLSAAEAAAGHDAWSEAARLLEKATAEGLPAGKASRRLIDGVERWRAPPKVEITTPMEGAEIQGLIVRLAGRLKTGRADDRLVVDGNAVPLDDEGRFSVNLPYAKAGTYRIEIEIQARGGTRRDGATRTVTLVEPELKVPAWAKVSVEQKEVAKRVGVDVAFENKLGMRFVLAPAGTFWMGSSENERALVMKEDSSAKVEYFKDETRHKVKLTGPYYVQIAEVTNKQYRNWKAEHDSGDYKSKSLNQGNQPVVLVSWDSATKYAEWLTQQDRWRQYALPTEAEWGYACRAGSTARYSWGDSTTEGWRYANAYDPSALATFGLTWAGWSRADGHLVAAPVGSYPPNGLGLYDMHGNVYEWCSDYYGTYPSSPLTIDPTGPSSGGSRVVRGGSWFSGPWGVRSAYRVRYDPGNHNSSLGFRLVVRLRP